MNSGELKLDFSHPWGEYLLTFNVPKEKHQEFYEQFGYYLYSISTPQDEKEKAFAWMIANRTKNQLSQ